MTIVLRPSLIAAAGVALFLGLSGCAGHDATPGDRMQRQAEGTESLAEQWNKGEKLAAKAVKDREQAQRDIARAENAIPEARQALDKAARDLEAAQRMMADAEAEYGRRFPGKSLRGN